MHTLQALATLLPDHPLAGFLILLGLVLFVAEFHAPTFGLLGIGGVASAMTGLFMLVNAVGPEAAGLEPGVLYGIGFVGLVMAAAAGWTGWRAARRRATTGPEALIGAEGIVRSWSGAKGRVHVQGEDWAAISESPAALAPGDAVSVTGIADLTLRISPLPPSLTR